MKTPQDIIDEAGVKQFPTDDTKKYLHLDNLVQLQKREAFSAGATFALSTPELWREHWTKFLEWVDKNYVNDTANRNTWFARSDGDIKTTDELFDLYQSTVK